MTAGFLRCFLVEMKEDNSMESGHEGTGFPHSDLVDEDVVSADRHGRFGTNGDGA